MTSRRVISKLQSCVCWRQLPLRCSFSPTAPVGPTSAILVSRLSPQYTTRITSSIVGRRRCFSTTKRKRTVDPFKVLQVKRQTPYAQVKKLFLRVAMQHHPDTTTAKSPEEQEKSRNIFIKARQAFEALAHDPETGGICLLEELEGYVADEEHAHMDRWFKQETGFDMPFMDEATMKEVAAMTVAVGGGGMDRGLDRDGGMWELARMVTRTVQSGGDGKNLLQLEAGDVKSNELNDANLRARRRKSW